MTRPQAVRLDRGASRLNHAVYDQLKERLLDGRYTAGERFSMEQLRTEFDVSKQPIMEALRRLSGDGLIDIIPQVGSRVATYQPHEVGDFFVMFGGFEGSIAGIAATRRTAEQLARPGHDQPADRRVALGERRRHPLTWLPRCGTGASTRPSTLMAHSRIMAETSRRMWDLSDFLINTTGASNPLSAALDERHNDHERIRAALHDGDQEQARSEMESHIVRTVEVIHETNEERGAS